MTTDTRAALAQALEALRLCNDAATMFERRRSYESAGAAIAAAEAALAAPQGEPVAPTDDQVVAALESAGVKFQRFMGGISGTKDCWSTAGSQSVPKLADGVRAMISAATAAPGRAETLPQMTREGAISIAKQSAWDAEPRPNYIPDIPSAAEWAAWMPHEWVIDAILRAAAPAPAAPARAEPTDEQIEVCWSGMHGEDGSPPQYWDFARAVLALRDGGAA